MPTLIKLGGTQVDAEDPCALYQALYAAKLKLLAGERVEETEVRSPVTQQRVRVSATNIAALDAELMRLAAACSAKNGKRSHYAKRIRFTC
ncbi:hypothetical protein [Mesorhizobium sp. WSM3859]|uniref:hypothetical protein n=1 Tax=Mesorhizobium sp. WSM3859 TaxID=2029402 RepID=UPI000BAEED8E|nr:hypothetical protein [Mesorhizobium sp. WSM3859]PBC09186.1 hypothetical protein CK230_17025 [Mesorhizobium sp. WSM3859]